MGDVGGRGSKPRILLTSCGSPPSQNILQSLREAPTEFYIVGCDASLYHLELGALDQAYEAPMNDDPRFLYWLADLCRKERIDFLHPQADRDVALLGKHRDTLGVQMSLPSQQMIKDAQYKPKSTSIWHKRSIRLDAPKMLLLPDDIAEAERRFGYPFWMRASRGAGASGSCKASNAQLVECGALIYLAMLEQVFRQSVILCFHSVPQ